MKIKFLFLGALVLALSFFFIRQDHQIVLKQAQITHKDKPDESKLRRASNAIPNQYIVVLRNDTLASEINSVANHLLFVYGGKLGHIYNCDNKHDCAIKGFSVETAEAAAIAMSQDPRVDHVTTDAWLTDGLEPNSSLSQSSTFYPEKFIEASNPVPNYYTVVLQDNLSEPDISSFAKETARIGGGRIKHISTKPIKSFLIETSKASAIAVSQDSRVKYVTTVNDKER